MHPLILSTFISLIILLVDLRAKCPKPAYKYITIFLLIAGISFFFKSIQAEAGELPDYYRYLRAKNEGIDIVIRNETKKKTKKEIEKDFINTCWNRAHYHYEEGCKCLKEAEEISLLFPDIPAFNKSNLCLVNLIGALAPGDPTYRIITITLTLVGQYAALFLDEWNRFKTLLLQSKTHFEMEEYYRLIGKYQRDLYNIEKKEREKKKS